MLARLLRHAACGPMSSSCTYSAATACHLSFQWWHPIYFNHHTMNAAELTDSNKATDADPSSPKQATIPAQAPAPTVANPSPIAGVWRRVAAFMLDGLAQGLIGMALGALASDALVGLGPWGRLLGFGIALAYFGFFNSRLGWGQSLGKRLLQIKVVDAQGAELPLGRAVLRYLPVGTVWFLSNAQLPDALLFSAWAAVLGLAIFGLGACLLYLFVFNRRSRQSLHDVLSGSFVVHAGWQGPVPADLAAPLPTLHRAVCALLLLLGALGPLISQQWLQKDSQTPFAPLAQILRAVNAEPWVQSSAVNQGVTYTQSSKDGSSRTIRHLSIHAISRDADIDQAQRLQALARLALAAHPEAAALDQIQITLAHGYDIGSASSWRYQRQVLSPAEWAASP